MPGVKPTPVYSCACPRSIIRANSSGPVRYHLTQLRLPLSVWFKWCMFREDDFRYLTRSVILALGLTIAAACYEVFVATSDTIVDTTLGIIRWQGVTVPLTITILATWEVCKKVIADRLIERKREAIRQEGRQEGRQEVQAAWEAWNHRRLEAEAQGRPFDEPLPSPH